MREKTSHPFVNWKDGMKINKNHFVDQNNAVKDALHDVALLNLSPYRYGLLPSMYDEPGFVAKITLDNSSSIRVAVDACQAVTPAGVRISLPAFSSTTAGGEEARPTAILPFSPLTDEQEWLVVLVVHPFNTRPAGPLDPGSDPPRHQYVVPSYTIELVSSTQFRQADFYPYAIPIGQLFVDNNEASVEHYYIPPCYSVGAHAELKAFLAKLESFLTDLERYGSRIIQRIFQKEQKGRIVELVQFLCDRMLLYLGGAISATHWTLLYDSPSSLFFTLAALARVVHNTLDLRIGSGKDELVNYLCKWCDQKPGELESLLESIANMKYQHNDVYTNIAEAEEFIKTLTRLFGNLSKLDFIGQEKEERDRFGFVLKEDA